MERFRSPELTDRAWAAPLLEAEGSLCCEYNFNTIYLWSRDYSQRLARVGDRLLVRIQGRLGVSYQFPAGTGPLEPAMEALRADAAAAGTALTLVCVTAQQRARLEETFPGRFDFAPDRDGYDYIYAVDRLADLSGKKLHAKRNHIHRFDETYPDWLFEPLGRENIRECLEVERRWTREKLAQADETMGEENVGVVEALYQREALGLEGGLIRAGGHVVAFSMGSFITPDCFDVHFEKADAGVQGAYAVINREMARMIRERYPDVRWFNREDDLGLEGLRKAKLSYYPDILLEKFTARER